MSNLNAGRPEEPAETFQDDGLQSDSFGDFGEERAFAAAQRDRLGKLKLSRGNMLLAALFLAGIASVYFLSLRNGPQPASAEDQTVENELNNFLKKGLPGVRDAEGQKLVDTFYFDMTKHQVPLEDLRANPFAFASSRTDKPMSAQPSMNAGDAQAARRRAEVDRELSMLRLQSVMLNDRGGTAIINSNFVTAGQMIGSFKVLKISAQHVELDWEGQSFVLRME